MSEEMEISIMVRIPDNGNEDFRCEIKRAHQDSTTLKLTIIRWDIEEKRFKKESFIELDIGLLKKALLNLNIYEDDI